MTVTPSIRTQRLIVAITTIVALFALVVFARAPEAAEAQSADAGHQPFNCGSNRNTLALANAGSNATMYPCLSGVQWRLRAGNLDAGATGNGNLTNYRNVVATIAGASAPGTATLKMANGSQQSLYHVAFSNLTFCSANGTPVNPCLPPTAANWGSADYDLKMEATSPAGTSPNSTLTINPDVAMTIGGSGTWTDLWATADSRITVRLVDVNDAAGFIGTLTGNGAGTCDAAGILTNPSPVRRGGNPGFFGAGGNDNGTCTITMKSFQDLNWLVGGSGFRITGMDIKFYYMATHTASVTDPYNPAQAPGNASIQLPNTNITVN